MEDLIDTQWNVNEWGAEQGKKYYINLIDTQWNVNKNEEENTKETQKGFNRYIVECK